MLCAIDIKHQLIGQWRSGSAPASNAIGPGFESQAGTDDCTKFSDCSTLSDESINWGPVWVWRWCLCQVSAGYNNTPSMHWNNIRRTFCQWCGWQGEGVISPGTPPWEAESCEGSARGEGTLPWGGRRAWIWFALWLLHHWLSQCQRWEHPTLTSPHFWIRSVS